MWVLFVLKLLGIFYQLKKDLLFVIADVYTHKFARNCLCSLCN